MANLTAEDRTAIVETSARLGIRPADLLAVMMYESAGTMDPDIKGGKGGRYTGLIQFGKSERRAYGYQPGMTVAEQVRGPVYNYLSDRGLPSGADLSTIYRTVNGGNPNAPLWRSDRPGSTIATHIDTIARNYVPNAEAVMSGTALPEAGPTTGVSQAMMAVVSRARQLSDVPFGMFPTSGSRTKAEQKALVQAGWSGTMNSKHIGGTAMDLVPMGPDGQPDPDAVEKYNEINRAMKQASAELGIPVKWGGDWKNPDRPHYQLVDPNAAAPATPYDPLSGRLIPQQVAPPPLLGFSPQMMAELQAANFPFRQAAPPSQDAQSAIADLVAPLGGTLVPSPRAALEAYAPYAPPNTPAQAAIADQFGQPGDLTADQIDELTRTDAAGNYTNPLVASPPARRPGPGGALGVDLGQMPAGMPPPPSRPGTFDWLGGGAPEAAMVPPPGISPLRPAFGGPGDRRPQPPTPPSRASGLPLPPPRPSNFDFMGGGAPDVAGLPLPPSRPVGMPPSAPQRPVGAFSGLPGSMSLEALLSPVRGPQAARDAVLAGLQDDPTSLPWRERIGQEGPVRPRTRMENAEMNLWRPDFSLAAGGNLGTPETQLSLDRPPAPPPGGGPDFASANPSPMLPPSWSPVTSFPGETLAMGANEEPISAPPEFDRGRFDDAFGVPPIPEVSAGGTVFKSPAETKAIQEAIAQGSPIDLRPQTGPPAAAAANPPSLPPAPRQKVATIAAATPTKTAEEQKKRNSFLSRLLPGGGNGFLGNFLGSFGTPPTFTAYGPTSPGWNNGIMNTSMGSFRTSGTAPYGNQGGTTPWRSGTSNAMGGTNALTWTDSRGQPVTVHENPWSPGTYMSSF